MRLLGHIRSDQKGAGAVEFAIVAPVLFLLILGVAQLGILYFAQAGLRHAAGEGARFATLYPRPTDQQIRDRILTRRYGLQSDRLEILPITYGATNGANWADINLRYTVPLNFFLYRPPPVTLNYNRRVYIQPPVT